MKYLFAFGRLVLSQKTAVAWTAASCALLAITCSYVHALAETVYWILLGVLSTAGFGMLNRITVATRGRAKAAEPPFTRPRRAIFLRAGTGGLHTFLLFLGPHIVRVVHTAIECDSTLFSTDIVAFWAWTPGYAPDAFQCMSVLFLAAMLCRNVCRNVVPQCLPQCCAAMSAAMLCRNVCRNVVPQCLPQCCAAVYNYYFILQD
jgi:hypothetical protein